MPQRLVNETTKNAGCRIFRCEIVTEINPVWLNGRVAVGKILGLGNSGIAQIIEPMLCVVRLKERLATKELVETRNCRWITDNLVFDTHM